MHLAKIEQQRVKLCIVRFDFSFQFLEWKLDFFLGIKNLFYEALAQAYVPNHVILRKFWCNFHGLDRLVVSIGTQLKIGLFRLTWCSDH